MILLTSDSPFKELPMFFLMLGIIAAISYVTVYYKDWIKSSENKDKTKLTTENKIKSRHKSVAQEQPYFNNPMRDTLKSMIRERMIGIVIGTYENNPMKDTPFEGLIIQNAIGTASEKYKESFLKERQKLGMSEKEITGIVDEVTKELLEQFLE